MMPLAVTVSKTWKQLVFFMIPYHKAPQPCVLPDGKSINPFFCATMNLMSDEISRSFFGPLTADSRPSS